MHNYLKRQPTHKEEIYRVTEDYVYADARHRWSDDDKLPARRRGTQTRSRQVSPGLTVGFMKREKKSRVTAESKNRLAGVELPGTSGTREKYFLFFMSYSESGGGGINQKPPRNPKEYAAAAGSDASAVQQTIINLCNQIAKDLQARNRQSPHQ